MSVLLFHTNCWNNIVTVTNGPFNTHTHWCIVCVFSLWCYLICSEFSSQHFYLSSPRRPCWSCAVSQFHSWRLCFMRPWTVPAATLAPTHSNSHTVTHCDTHTVFMLTVSPSSWWSLKIITVSPFQHIFQTSIFTAQRLQDVFSESPAV